MAFRKKAEFVLIEHPDILIIPECEHPHKLDFDSLNNPSDFYWYGENPNKGIGIFTYSGFRIEVSAFHNTDFKYVLPLVLINDNIELTLFAIWSQKPKSHDCYTEQIWNAVHFYKEYLDKENVILAGDFNSNSIWDKPNRVYNHTNLVKFLDGMNIISTYHQYYNQEHGKEILKTFHLYRKIEKSYHIDFCFASENLCGKVKNVSIGEYNEWIKLSDHKPLIVDFTM